MRASILARIMSAPAHFLLFSTCPDEASATSIARALVEERLAACVQQLGPLQSTYWWQGQVQQECEIQLVIKTCGERLQAAMDRLTQLHPYELPECVAVQIQAGLPAYLDWIQAQTREETL